MPDAFEYYRQVPMLGGVEVLVAGGGIAGACAAVAAARQGAQVLLLDRYGCLGGTAVASGVGAFCGQTHGQGRVFDDLLEIMAELGALESEYRPHRGGEARAFDHQLLAIAMDELVGRERNVRVLFWTSVIDAACRDGRVESVVIHNKSGLQAIVPRTVVDCTGEADLAHRAGFASALGRDTDHAQLPMSLMFFLRKTDTVTRQPVPAWYDPTDRTEDLPNFEVWQEQADKIAVKTKLVGYDATDGQSLSRAHIAARRHVAPLVRRLQDGEYPAFKLDHLPLHIGVREGRRPVGEHVLTADQVRAAATFADAVARGTCNFLHPNWATPDTDKAVTDSWAVENVPTYQIPYRCLVPKGSRNLLVAGRCISVDQVAFGSTFHMPVCAMTGQAAGIAAAWSAALDKPVGAVDVERLQKVLKQNGAVF